MKKYPLMTPPTFARILAILTCIAFNAVSAYAQVPLVTKGVPKSVIVPGTGVMEARAAVELQSYLQKVSGATVPIIAVNGAGGPSRILIGTPGTNSEIAALEATLNIAGHSLGRDGIMIKTVGTNTLVLAGAESPGALYAVYSYLDNLGVRWFFPNSTGKKIDNNTPQIYIDDPGEYVPSATTINANYATEFVKIPDFTYRAINPVCASIFNAVTDGSTTTYPDIDWLSRNRFNVMKANGYSLTGPNPKYDNTLKPRGFRPSMLGESTMSAWLPKATYFTAHPEYYALWKNGNPNAAGVRVAEQPCVSNPDVVNTVAANIASFLSANPDAVNEPVMVGQVDLSKWCQCPQCLAMDDASEHNGTVSNPEAFKVSTRWQKFIRNVANKLHETYPNATLATFAYQGTLEPPYLGSLSNGLQLVYCSYNRCTTHNYGILFDGTFENGILPAGWKGSVIQEADGNHALSTSGAVYQEYSIGCNNPLVQNLADFDMRFRFKFTDTSYFYAKFLKDPDYHDSMRALVGRATTTLSYAGSRNFHFPGNVQAVNLSYPMMPLNTWYQMHVVSSTDNANNAINMRWSMEDAAGNVIAHYKCNTPLTHGNVNLISGTTGNMLFDNVSVKCISPLTGEYEPACPRLYRDQWRIESWGNLASIVNYGYYSSLAPGYPHALAYTIADELKFLKQRNGSGWMSELCPDQPPRFGFEGASFCGDGVNIDQAYDLLIHDWYANKLAYYVAARLMWDINTDVEALKNEFFTKFYGAEAGAFMRQYHDRMEKAWKDHDKCVSTLSKRNTHVDFLNDTVISEIDEILANAISAADASGNSLYISRVERDSMLFGKWEALYNDYQNDMNADPSNNILFQENFETTSPGLLGLLDDGTSVYKTIRSQWHGKVVVESDNNHALALASVIDSKTVNTNLVGVVNGLANRWTNFEARFRFKYMPPVSGTPVFYLKYLKVPTGSPLNGYALDEISLRGIVLPTYTTLQYSGHFYGENGIDQLLFDTGTQVKSTGYPPLLTGTWYWMVVSATGGNMAWCIKADVFDGTTHAPAANAISSYQCASVLADGEGGITLNVGTNEIRFDDFRVIQMP